MRDLLLLLRAPLAASAVSNVLLGAALSAPQGVWREPRVWTALALLSVASVCLYWAGMGLNDYFDRARDAELYPKRVIPSGRVSAGKALAIGAALMGAGMVLAALAAWVATGSAGRGALGGAAVAACVLGYDVGLKRWRLVGSLAMGSCRTSNALMGAFALGWWTPAGLSVEHLGQPTLLYALALGVYVTFLTFLSTYEDERAGVAAMTVGYGGVLLAPCLLVTLPLLNGDWRPLALLGGLALFALVLGQLVLAIMEGTRNRGEASTRALLQGLWLLDLGVILGRGPLFLVGPWFLLFAALKLGARALFRPPPEGLVIPDTALDMTPEPRPQKDDETSAPSPGTMGEAGDAGGDASPAEGA